MKEQFVKSLLRLIRKETKCNIQHKGCACNTCFHDWARRELKLSVDMAHLFWLVTLSLRGDYTEEEIIKANKGNFEELVLQGV